MAKILIIDDEETMCHSLSLVARRNGHEALGCLTLREGLEKAAIEPFDLVFLDVRMPDGNGLDILPRLAGSPSAPEIIIMTGFGDPMGAELAIKSGAWDYIEKGASVKDITLSLVRALEYRKQKVSLSNSAGVVALKREKIIGNSPGLNLCLDQVAQAAGSEASVLIVGETGSGKELFARAVHQNSRRADNPFVVVDCAALPETLIESLLFGYEKGSFTGADHSRGGLFSDADGGTLFLDEVGELPLPMQKAFLRVLQERRFRPVGSQKEIESNFRVVAATNRNLAEMAQNGQFRNDLLFRLSSFTIELPPLRTRCEDIKELTRYFMDSFCEQYNIPPKGCCPEFMDALTAYSWPGNMREFKNTMERTILAARQEPMLFVQHLPTSIRVQLAQAAVRHENAPDHSRMMATPDELPPLSAYRENVYDQAEKQYLQELMISARDDISVACRISGLSQSRLYALLKNHKLQR
jgi:two-component system NtrC family response regulator